MLLVGAGFAPRAVLITQGWTEDAVVRAAGCAQINAEIQADAFKT